MLLLLAASCAYNPRYTPEGVLAPESLARVLEDASYRHQRGLDPLSLDRPSTLTVSRDGAILTAVARNRSLAVEQFNPDISRTFISEARADFDPSLLATISYGRSTDQLRGSRFQSEAAQNFSTSRDADASARVENFFPTGTQVFLTGGIDRTRSTFTEEEFHGNWSLGVTQSLLRGAGTAVNLVELRQARNQAAISFHQLNDFVIELVRQVEIAYWDLVLANSRLEIFEFSVRLAEEQLDLNEIYLEVGKGVIGDVLSARAALAARRADLIDARADVRRQSIELIRLLNPERADQFDFVFDPADTPLVEWVDVQPVLSAEVAALYRPDLAEGKLRIANRDLEIIRTRNGLLPRLDMFASYGRTSLGDSYRGAFRHLDERTYDNYEVGADFQWFPINRGARARNARAQFELAQAEAALSNLHQLIDARVHQAGVEVRRQWERIEATQLSVAGREEELRAIQEEFEVGIATTLDVLTVQENLVQARLDAATAEIRYIQALTELFAEEGTLLERRGVGFSAESDLAGAQAR